MRPYFLIELNRPQLIDLSDLTLAARKFPLSFLFSTVSQSCETTGTFLFATKQHDVTLRYKHWSAVLSEAVLQRFGPDFELVKEEKLVGVSSLSLLCRFSRSLTSLFSSALHYTLRSQSYSQKDQRSRSNRDQNCDFSLTLPDHSECVSLILSTLAQQGFSAEYGNKGSVLLRFVIDDTSFCLINSHLAAGTNAPGRRERDLIEIFDSGPRFTRPASGTKRAYVGGGDGTQISDAELIFFSGAIRIVEILRLLLTLSSSQVISTSASTCLARKS